uniref:Kelch-like protein 12 n=1 Tax=Phallusia mammillata TaxID=59560 RepID=A0A6F9DGU3_9ASCI|nr:kelch-like protein 12 [Phallusia mammillata]
MDNCIYLLGCRTSYTASNSVEKFNLNFPESGWKKSTPMPKENHSLLTSVFKNSHIFAKGSSWSAQTHVFAVKSRKWTSVPCDQNFTNTFIPTSDRIYGFPSWQYCDVPGAQWKPVAKKVENVLFGIACGSNIYLFAEDENGISLHLYDTLQETATKENTMTGTTHVKDACFVNGNIVAVVKSLNEGWLLKEYEVQKSEWRVLTGIKDEQDFNKIFSL